MTMESLSTFAAARAQADEGHYEKALSAAKRATLDALHEDRREIAALALALTGDVYCSMNQHAKARPVCQQAYDLALSGRHAAAAAYARGVAARALLGLGDPAGAEEVYGTACEWAGMEPGGESRAIVKLIGAEVALAAGRWAEAHDRAEEAATAAAALGRYAVQARALLVLALAADRGGDADLALMLLGTAEGMLRHAAGVETLWQIKAALAAIHRKRGWDREAEALRDEAARLVDRIVSGMSPQNRERFLRSSALATVTGGPAAGADASDAAAAPPDHPLRSLYDLSPEAFNTLRPLLEVIKQINSELDLRPLITVILDKMIEFCNAERGTIVVFRGDEFKLEISRRLGRQDLQRFEMGVSSTALRLVRERGRKIVAGDAQLDAELAAGRSVHEMGLLSILCIPLRVRLKLVGAIYLDNPVVTDAFGTREQEVAEILTDHAAVAIGNALLRIQSTQDGLTRLDNHTRFEHQIGAWIEACRRDGRPCGMLMLDADRFKQINDRFGHEAGNVVIKGLADILRSEVRGCDVVARVSEAGDHPVIARYGGDEFEVLLPHAGREALQGVAERIRQAVERAGFHHDGHPLGCAVSVGGAVFPDDAADAHALILRADEALYRAKQEGGNRVAFHGPGVKLSGGPDVRPRPAASSGTALRRTGTQ